MALDSFGSYLGWRLEHTGHAVTALTKKLCLKSNLASLAIHYLLEALQWTLLKHAQSAVLVCQSLGFIFTQALSQQRLCHHSLHLEHVASKVSVGEEK